MDKRGIDFLNALVSRGLEPTTLADIQPKARIGEARGLGTIDDVQVSGIAFPLTEVSRVTVPLDIYSTDGTVRIIFNRIERLTVVDGVGNSGDIIFNHPTS